MIWGKTAAERRADRERFLNWHKWFAWHPISLDEGEHAGRIVWLDVVERKPVSRVLDDIFFYRLPQEKESPK